MTDEATLRARHVENLDQRGYCKHCSMSMPCGAIIALDIAKAERELADRLAEALRGLMVSDAIIDSADEYDLIQTGSWPGPYIEARDALRQHDEATR